MPIEAERLAALRDLQARFAVALRAEQWQDAQALAAQRFAAIDQLVHAHPSPDALSELAAIAAADRALLPQVEAAHARCGNELHDLGRARKAVRAYAP